MPPATRRTSASPPSAATTAADPPRPLERSRVAVLGTARPPDTRAREPTPRASARRARPRSPPPSAGCPRRGSRRREQPGRVRRAGRRGAPTRAAEVCTLAVPTVSTRSAGDVVTVRPPRSAPRVGCQERRRRCGRSQSTRSVWRSGASHRVRPRGTPRSAPCDRQRHRPGHGCAAWPAGRRRPGEATARRGRRTRVRSRRTPTRTKRHGGCRRPPRPSDRRPARGDRSSPS